LSHRPKKIDIGEKELQALTEKDLSQLEPGLKFVDRYVPVSTGIIDTLALDSENNPVIIEYKAVGETDEEGLIQSLAYANWIDANPDSLLMFVTAKNIVLSGSLIDVRIILVTPSFSERTLNASQMVEPHILLSRYICFDHPSTGKWLHFEPVFDSRKTRAGGRPTAYELGDHFEGSYAKMRPVFDRLEAEARKLGSDITIYAKKYYIAFQRNYIFAVVNVYTNKIEVGVVLEGAQVGERLLDGSDWGWSRVTHYFVLNHEKDVDD